MRSFVSSRTQEWDVEHSPIMAPQDLLNFVYLDEFIDDWSKIFPNDFDEEALWALEILIMSGPERPPVIQGTGGLRKIRFAHGGAGGKSGGNRICYAYFPDYQFVLMLLAYPKSKRIDLTSSEREGVKSYLEQVKNWLETQSQRRATDT